VFSLSAVLLLSLLAARRQWWPSFCVGSFDEQEAEM